MCNRDITDKIRVTVRGKLMDSYFGKGVKLTGTLWAKGDVHFEADFVGEVFSENHFFVGQSGYVDGDLHVYDFSNSGKVKGNIFSENKTRLMLGSNLKGNISTYQLVIDEGADFEGRCKMIDAPPVAMPSKNKILLNKSKGNKILSSIPSNDKIKNSITQKLAPLKAFGFALVALLVVGIFLLRYPWNTGFKGSLTNGYKLLKNNHYEEAEKAFNKALSINIDSPEVYIGLGETFYQNKRYIDSIAQFKKAIELKPSNSDYKVKLAMAYDRSKKLTDAETFYRLAIDANSDNANAYYHYGIFMQARGDLNGAINNFRKATKLKKGFYQAHNFLGKVFLKMGKKSEATKEFKLSLKSNKNNPALHLDIGKLYLSVDNLPKAEYHFNESFKLSPQDSQLATKIGKNFEGKGLLNKSIQFYKIAASLQPKNDSIQSILGSLYYRTANTDDALVAYKKARKLNLKNSENLYMIGRLLSSAKKFKEARVALEQVLVLRGIDAPTYYQLGLVGLAEFDFIAAEKSLALAVKNDINNHKYLKSLSDAQLGNKNYDAAIVTVLKAIKLIPSNAIYSFSLCNLYSKKRFYSSAIKYCQNALNLDSEDLEIMNRLAWLYAKKNIKLTPAIELINKAIQASPNRADFIDTLSELYYVKGDISMAVINIRKAISIEPKNLYYKQQLRRFETSDSIIVSSD